MQIKYIHQVELLVQHNFFVKIPFIRELSEALIPLDNKSETRFVSTYMKILKLQRYISFQWFITTCSLVWLLAALSVVHGDCNNALSTSLIRNQLSSLEKAISMLNNVSKYMSQVSSVLHSFEHLEIIQKNCMTRFMITFET